MIAKYTFNATILWVRAGLNRIRDFFRRAFLFICLLFFFSSTAALASQTLSMSGSVSYQAIGNTVVLSVDKIDGSCLPGTAGQSGSLELQLWAFSQPFSGTGASGYKLATYPLSSLSCNYYYSNVNSGSIAYTSPPSGTWYYTLVLAEYGDDWYSVDYRNFSNPVTIGGGTGSGTVTSSPAAAEVIEFYHAGLDNYFITADANEAAAIDNGGAGAGWSRTGDSFRSGGGAAVCRFYGSISPGPNSHFYTVLADECASLKQTQAATPSSQKRWNFESNDFFATIPANSMCPSGTVPVYRAYNNGYARGVDSNHRITANRNAIQQVIARGWIDEGVVMCAADAGSSTTPTPTPVQNYAGAYAGTYSGTDSGTFSITIDAGGTLSGTGSSIANAPYTFNVSGSIKAGGTVSMTSSGTAGSATFSGSIDAAGALTGTWQGEDGDSGTFSGKKQSATVTCTAPQVLQNGVCVAPTTGSAGNSLVGKWEQKMNGYITQQDEMTGSATQGTGELRSWDYSTGQQLEGVFLEYGWTSDGKNRTSTVTTFLACDFNKGRWVALPKPALSPTAYTMSSDGNSVTYAGSNTPLNRVSAFGSVMRKSNAGEGLPCSVWQ